MSVDHKQPTEAQTTCMQAWTDALNESKIPPQDALSIAAMMLGYVIVYATDSERAAHDIANEVIVDLHSFINDNYVAMAWARNESLRRQSR